jgi:hypothetical protein
VKQRWDAALRSLARRSRGPFRTLLYGVSGASEDQAALAAELEQLAPGDGAPEVVVEVADPFTGALQRPLFKSRVLGWIKSPPTSDRSSADARRALETISSDLAGFLENLDSNSGLRLVSASRRAERPPAPIVRLRRFEDLGGDAESIAGAVEAILIRGSHLELVLEGMDTRTREGRAMAAVTMRLGDLKAVRARERSLLELTRRRDELRVYGPIPFGFDRRGEGLVPIPEQLKTVSRLRELARRGMSLLESALVLNRERRFWKDGTPWTGKRVGQILRNPLYDRHLRESSA